MEEPDCQAIATWLGVDQVDALRSAIIGWNEIDQRAEATEREGYGE